MLEPALKPVSKARWVDRVSSHFRARRADVLRRLLASEFRRRGAVRVLDLGGRLSFWQRLGETFLADHNVHVTILNLTPTEAENNMGGGNRFAFHIGDATATTYPDHSFDVVVSNSVIEHLTTWDAMIAFADETKRLAPAYYCQTPNYWFPIDPHYAAAPFFHWLPRPTRAWLVRTFPITYSGRIHDVRQSFSVTDAARLLCFAQMRNLFPDADLIPERFAGVFVKSWMAVKSKA